MISAAFTGFFTGFSLILAIGAQNAFVLRQGILHAHVLPLCLFCALSDAILITMGVAGFGYIVNLAPWLPTFMALGGAVFLFAYGSIRFIAAWRADFAMQIDGKTNALWPTLGIAAALTWLNPHVYLDTLGLIGAISTQYTDLNTKWAFGLSAASASFVFFFSLGYGARLLAPIMKTTRAWRVLDCLIGLIMYAIAAKLIFGLV